MITPGKGSGALRARALFLREGMFARGTHRRIAGAVRALAALFVAVATLAGGVAAGHRYFFCATMEVASWSTCCPHDDDRTSGDEPAIDGDDGCCEEHRLSAPGSGVSVAAREELRAPMVAIVPSAVVLVASEPRAPRFVTHARAGPHARDPRTYRTFLNVSLT